MKVTKTRERVAQKPSKIGKIQHNPLQAVAREDPASQAWVAHFTAEAPHSNVKIYLNDSNGNNRSGSQ
jgi:hypothetical protein